MIHVDRSKVAIPEALRLDRSSPAEKELKLAAKFFTKSGKHSGQSRFEFKAFRRPEVRKAVLELFHGKCAYCESRLSVPGHADLEQFRPKASVLESPEHPGYWWLAMVWDNLLIACSACNRTVREEGVLTGKANRFPLENEDQRAFRPGDEALEQPLLLDPCVDHPEAHLVFDTDGKVFSETLRGQTTIAILGLNRASLMKRRREAAQEVLAQLQLFEERRPKPKHAEMTEWISRMTDASEEFAGLKRQLLMVQRQLHTPANVLAGQPVKRKRRARKAFAAFEKAQSSYTLDDESGRLKYRTQRRMIERITIKNIKGIQELDLVVPNESGKTPWLMLLGENGVGKSTVLQATALALIGSSAYTRLIRTRDVHPKDFVRNHCKSGSIRVKLSGFHKPHRLEFYDDRVEFKSPTDEQTTVRFRGTTILEKGSGWVPQALLLGYGATRLLPRGAPPTDEDASAEFSRVDNLFDPFVPLLNAQRWMLGLDQARFDDTALILKDLLALPKTVYLEREDAHVVVVAGRQRVPLRHLSDGYQSVVALTVDVLEVAHRIWPKLQDAEGIVLLDELGAHLHPTWKMRIVASLRRALPAMQFLATTHDPLCLRGLGNGEVAVLRRDERERVFAMQSLPSPADFRVDQLLTSDFFGLNSTVDPDVEAIFDEYYALLALRGPTAMQIARRDELREELKNRRHLGTTLRENLMYEAVDRLLADHRRDPKLTVDQLQKATIDQVAEIWNEQAPTSPHRESDTSA